jgi:flavorubredoxin
MGIEVFEPGLQVQYRPFQEDLNKCHQFGMEFAKFVKEYDQRIMDR